MKAKCVIYFKVCRVTGCFRHTHIRKSPDPKTVRKVAGQEEIDREYAMIQD